MPTLVAQSSVSHTVPNVPQHLIVTNLQRDASMEEELDAMVSTLRSLEGSTPDIYIDTCMAFMGRCTEMLISLHRQEANGARRAKIFRTTQLQPLMELIEFLYRGSSRLIEVRRQEVELSK